MTDKKQTLAPPELARRWGVCDAKILGLIRAGQLRAFNSAINPNGRARYRISLAEIARFEEARTVGAK